MNRKIHFGGIFATSILLALMLLGFRPEPLAEAARNGPGDIPVATKQHLLETYGKLPLSFEANVGQTSSQVAFLSRGQGYTLFLTRHAEAVLVLGKSAPKRTPAQPADKLAAFVEPQREAVPPAVLRMKLLGAKLTPQVESVDEFPGKANYIIGNDPKLKQLQDIGKSARWIGSPGPVTVAAAEVLDQHVITNMFGRFATGQGAADDVIKEAVGLQKQIYQKRGLA